MGVFRCVCICVYMYVCMYVCMYTRMYVWVCLGVYVYVYICMYTSKLCSYETSCVVAEGTEKEYQARSVQCLCVDMPSILM